VSVCEREIERERRSNERNENLRLMRGRVFPIDNASHSKIPQLSLKNGHYPIKSSRQ